MKIRGQFITGILMIVIIAIAATTYVNVKDAEAVLLQSVQDRGKLIINYLSGVVIDPLLKKDELQVSAYIKRVSDTPGMSYLLVTDAKGIIAGSADVGSTGRAATEVYKNLPGPGSQPGEVLEIIYRGTSMNIKNFSSPLEVKNNGKSVLLGAIYAGFDMRAIESEINGIYLKSGVIGALAVLMSLILAISLTNTIIRPLQQIMEGTEIVAAGNMRHKIKVRVKNEFQALANSFNDMTEKLNDYYDGVLNAFTIALDTRDKYTPGHSKRVALLSVELGKRLNLSGRQLENTRIAAILKDIGNISVDKDIFSKKEALSPDDIIKIQKHPEVSARILKNIQQMKDVIPIILQHHERYDGLGYPVGLRANEILKEAKILAITDAYDAMVTPREHREAMPVEECIYELRLNKGKQFDPEITEAFIELINKKGAA